MQYGVVQPPWLVAVGSLYHPSTPRHQVHLQGGDREWLEMPRAQRVADTQWHLGREVTKETNTPTSPSALQPNRTETQRAKNSLLPLLRPASQGTEAGWGKVGGGSGGAERRYSEHSLVTLCTRCYWCTNFYSK